jgi:hypothetical protein
MILISGSSLIFLVPCVCFVVLCSFWWLSSIRRWYFVPKVSTLRPCIVGGILGVPVRVSIIGLDMLRNKQLPSLSWYWYLIRAFKVALKACSLLLCMVYVGQQSNPFFYRGCNFWDLALFPFFVEVLVRNAIYCILNGSRSLFVLFCFF